MTSCSGSRSRMGGLPLFLLARSLGQKQDICINLIGAVCILIIPVHPASILCRRRPGLASFLGDICRHIIRRLFHRPLFNALVFPGLGALAAFRSPALALDRLCSVQLPCRVRGLLGIISSEFREDLRNPSNKKLPRAICFRAFWKAAVGRGRSTGDPTEKCQRFADLVHN